MKQQYIATVHPVSRLAGHYVTIPHVVDDAGSTRRAGLTAHYTAAFELRELNSAIASRKPLVDPNVACILHYSNHSERRASDMTCHA